MVGIDWLKVGYDVERDEFLDGRAALDGELPRSREDGSVEDLVRDPAGPRGVPAAVAHVVGLPRALVEAFAPLALALGDPAELPPHGIVADGCGRHQSASLVRRRGAWLAQKRRTAFRSAS